MSNNKKNIIRTAAGSPWVDNQNSKSAGARGPLMLENYQLIEKLTHQNRERIPERTVHAKGSGAFGTFTVTQDITQYSCASIFAEVGKKTDMLARFSVVAGERGCADAERDVRGFALKFYTDDGNWDLVGNNTPIFFIRDPMKFPDFIHSQKRHPRTNLRSATAMWDYWSLSPESLHQVAILMSDRGIPKNYRQMHGFGSHTYSLWNKSGERFWVKFHFKSQQGIENYTDEEAADIVGKTRESSQEDLYNNIEKGNFPRWTLYIQVMPEKEADEVDFNPFDLTKVWSHKAYPLQEVGVMELNRNAINYFSEIEQAAFAPSNIVPGIGFSPDRVLQGRLFSYEDAHRYRIGINHEALPVNRSKVDVKNYHQDGAMRFDNPTPGDGDYYEPNSFGGPVEDESAKEPPLRIHGDSTYYEQRVEEDDFVQPRALYQLFNDDEKQRFHGNIARAMQGVPENIIERQLAIFKQADPAWAEGVRRALKEVK